MRERAGLVLVLHFALPSAQTIRLVVHVFFRADGKRGVAGLFCRLAWHAYRQHDFGVGAHGVFGATLEAVVAVGHQAGAGFGFA